MTPAECMEYTQVFMMYRLEIGLAMIFGLVLGILIGRWDS